MRNITVIVLTVAVVALIVLTRPDTKAELQPLPLPGVAVETVRLMDVQPKTVITGRLQPARKAHLRFEVSGKVTGRYVEPGQRVATGELLLKIDEGDFLDTVEETRALLLQEQKAIDRDRQLLELVVKERQLLEQELARLHKLGQESLASKSKYDEAEQKLLRQRQEEARLRYSVETASSRLQTRRAGLDRAQRNLDRVRLTAPFQATVNAVQAVIGDYVSPGQPAVDLVQTDELDLYLEAPGRVVSSLARGQEITISVAGQKRSGRTIALAVDPDPNTNTYAVRIRLPGIGLTSGQLARAELPGAFLQQVPVVPLTSILHEEGKSYVYTLDRNHVVKTPVRLIKRYGALQVIDGLASGTSIVARDVTVLTDGQEVSVE
ncbi:MAG: efflux RND transporter periplasmic adaptor subunit [Gammaproteobacteria bacterium]